MKTSTRVICALAQLEKLRGSVSYAQFCEAADAAVCELAGAVGGPLALSSFTETPLWLAAERMVNAGKFEQYIANVYELSTKAPVSGVECPMMPAQPAPAQG